ncbi:hypothetical protein [Sediminicoccus sp. KRV36]|uniref:hypothetical protein n=1 Tax=Sediminicoccus sp. KRV36 TaxID=3133721 RepID=UPI00200CA20D|nr:hypothetical protein [Sediminicoccus rosea]UPY38302.1 hypothetical protein LHU95_06280 [Sediminicoccus rosea]
MPDRRYGLDSVTACFPDQAGLILRLCLSDPSFRSMCEEYALARNCLSRFEELGDAAHGTEIADYRSVIRALEGEIKRFVSRSA